MRKYLLGMVAILVAVIAAIPGGGIASAQAPENYSAEYSSTNFYSSDGILTYYFSGLDVNTNYSWLLQRIDENGAVSGSFDWRASLGSTTATVSWSGAAGDFTVGTGDTSGGVFGETYLGALRVIDSFGQLQGTHYTLPGCNLVLSVSCKGFGTDWILAGTAINPETQRFGIGNRSFTFQSLNSDNYFHPTAQPNIVLTKVGEFTFLHYRFGLAALTDLVKLYDLSTGDLIRTFQVSDLIDYQVDDRNSVLTPSYSTNNFVILNTSGQLLPFINSVENNTAFENAGSWDNPHEMLLLQGAYDYVLTNNIGIWKADGESIFLVGNKATDEWGISNNQDVVIESGALRLELQSATEEIYNDGFQDHLLSDSQVGVVDTSDYAFQLRRASAYTVSPISQLDVTTTWRISPVVLNQLGASVTQRSFTVDLLYSISNEFEVSGRIENTLAGFGMDSPLGRGLGMLLIMAVIMLFIAKSGAKSLIPFGLVYLTVGGAWLALGLGDTITTVLFGITSIFLIFVMINSRKAEGGV